MPTRHQRILWVLLAILSVSCSIATWTAFKFVGWASELPNRFAFEIDDKAIAHAIGSSVMQAYHQVLRNGDASMLADVLRNQLIPYAKSDSAAATWIRVEYGDDIRMLTTSDDSAVLYAATELLALLDADVKEKPTLRD